MLTRKGIIAGRFLFMMLLISASATAEDVNEDITYDQVQLNIYGSVKVSPCVVAGGTAMNVDLGKHLQHRFLAAPGSATRWVSFSLKLIDCPDSTTEVTATYSGTPSESGDMYANTGTAQNVAIELQREDGQNLGSGKTYPATINAETAEAVFDMRARVYTASGNATAGTVSGTVSITFVYK